MPDVATIAEYLERFAPPQLAAEWDNVGLLLGDRSREVKRIMTCLTVTPETTSEAVAERADLVVPHHPFPFKPLRRITSDLNEGRMLLELAAARIAVYSPHTAFDSAAQGINRWLAEAAGLQNIAPLIPDADDANVGTGRMGDVAGSSLAQFAAKVAKSLKLSGLQIVCRSETPVRRVAVGCGSAGELLEAAMRQQCDCFLTGEARFHACLEAQAAGIALVLVGHYASERFAVDRLAEILAAQFPGVTVWASRREQDPLAWVSSL